MVQSLQPATIKSHLALYMDIMFATSALSRAQREMIAVIVSVTNGCEYCTTHHSKALLHYWKDEERVKQLIKTYTRANLSTADMGMCEYAIALTLYPGLHEQNDFTVALKDKGLTDEAILDVTLVVSYFNFVNRMVMALGVTLEAGEGEGFKY